MLGISIRARLALWYAAVFAVSLGAVAIAMYGVVARRSLANVDAALHEAASAVATTIDLEAEDAGKRSVKDVVSGVVREFRFRDLQVSVLDRGSGTLIPGEAPSGDEADSSSDTVTPSPTPTFEVNVAALRDFLADAPASHSTYEDLPSDQGEVRALALPHRVGSKQVVIGAVHHLKAHRRLLAGLQIALGLGIPLLLILSTLGGYLLARKSMQPVAVMTEHAARISATTLHDRLPVSNPNDELGRLAAVFNDLLARLGAAFEQQRQFLADASHELRTPVAIVAGEAELALSRDERGADELRTALRAIREEMQSLQRIVEDLFLLARARAGERLLSPTELYLGELCAECVRSVRSLAAKKQMTVRYNGGDEFPMRGDEALLRRLVLNLLDNAIKYTPIGGTVEVSVRAEKGSYVVDVADTGPGIPADSQERVFDRFYRAHRGREAGAPASGAGLGLAIARSIAVAHAGTLTLERTGEDGSVFRITLPASSRRSAELPALAGVSG